MPRTITAGPTRAEEVKRERRRKPGSLSAPGIKLSVDESKLDRSKNHYRFVKDTGGRVQQLINQDYEPVTLNAKADSNGLGSVSSAHGGVEDGKPFNMVLMSKPKDWHDADQKEKQQPLDAMEEAIRRGKHVAGNALSGEGVYTPGEGNQLAPVDIKA